MEDIFYFLKVIYVKNNKKDKYFIWRHFKEYVIS